MTDEEAQAIKDRALHVTPGPWMAMRPIGGESPSEVTWTHGPITYSIALCRNPLEGQKEADADFIAHAREDIPALIAEVEQWRAIGRQVAELREPRTDRRSTWYCVLCESNLMAGWEHEPDCPVLKVSALLAGEEK